jgi:hypothetical protein
MEALLQGIEQGTRVFVIVVRVSPRQQLQFKSALGGLSQKGSGDCQTEQQGSGWED